MNALDIVTILILCLLEGAHYLCRPFLVQHKTLLLILIFSFVAASLGLHIYTDYHTIALSPPPLNYLLPPHAPLSAYALTVWNRLIAPYTLSLLLSLITYLLATKMRFFKDRLHENEALYIVITIFLMRHPYWIAYCASLLLLAIIAAVIGTIRSGKDYRFSLYVLWLPSGIIAVLGFPLLRLLPLFQLIGFSNLY